MHTTYTHVKTCTHSSYNSLFWLMKCYITMLHVTHIPVLWPVAYLNILQPPGIESTIKYFPIIILKYII